MTVEPFRALLAGLGLDPTPREIAEILWLATRLPAAPSDTAEPTAVQMDVQQSPDEDTAADIPQLPDVQPDPETESESEIPVYPRTPAGGAGDATRFAATPVRLAADPPLPRQLELLRALRPLKRRVASRHIAELDEEATLESMAQRSVLRRTGTFLPVLRPAAERWLDVVLVVDGHPTGLLLWTPLVREVHRLLVELGAFRDIRLRYLQPRPDGSAGLSAHPTPHPDRIRDTSEIHDPSGRRLVLVLTDGVAPSWHNPAVRQAIRQWAAAGPLAVLQALPERLWRRTALPTVPARLRRSPLSAANVDLAYSGRRRGTRELPEGSIPVPVLELSPDWLKPWAGLVAGTGAPAVDAAVTLLADRPVFRQPVADDRPPDRRLRDFHATATPDAFRLLASLSAVPLSVAVMRVVQAAMLPGTAPTVLAEVMFSGLITPTATDPSTAPADVPYDFLPGVRAVLLESLRAHEVDQILREVSRYVECSGTAAGRVSGMLPDPAHGDELISADTPWARLRQEALVRAGLAMPSGSVPPPATGTARPAVRGAGLPYRLADLVTMADFSDVYLGFDADGNQAVVKVPPRAEEAELDVFQALVRVEAEALRRMDGRFAPSLLGIDRGESPAWLAMDCVTSISGRPAANLVRRPWWSNGPPDDPRALSALARVLAEALDQAHMAGIVHGNLASHAVLLVPDSVVLISWVYAQFDGRPHPRPQYREHASGYLPPEGYPQDEPLDPSFDIYGLGRILHYEATRGDSPARSVRSARGRPKLPSHLGDLGKLIEWCLDPDPSRRPTARQFIEELRELPPPRGQGGAEAADPRGSWERLESLPGLEGLKRFLEHLRIESASTLAEPAPVHLAFAGNPGTGKTTGARLIGEISRDLGRLRHGHLVVVRLADLVSEYVGQTAQLVNETVDRALDGVLFIDEVYGVEDRRGWFGDEVIATLLTRMEADRDRLAVVLAGTPRRVSEFLSVNPGLARRFPRHSVIEFPDLGAEVLMTILEARFAERGIELTGAARDELGAIVGEMHRSRTEYFANGRAMRSLADAVVRQWVGRVGREAEEPVGTDDIPESYRAYLVRPEGDPSAVLAELDHMVGLGPVRDTLAELVDRLSTRRGQESGSLPHMVFTGSPGTAKTTVARLVGRLLHELGLLRSGHCVEVVRSDLVGEYVGQTAPLVRGAVQRALDGVLFIDEAYSLGRGTADPGGFEAEALDTLIGEMGFQQGRLVVIVAGYPAEMDEFLAAHQTLASRFGMHVRFPDLDTAALVEVLRHMAARRGFVLGADVPERAAAWLEATRVADPAGFANARTVAALLDLMEGRMTERHADGTTSGDAVSAELFGEDVPDAPDPTTSG